MVVSSDLVRLSVSGSVDAETRSDYHDAQWLYWPDQAIQRSLANQGYQPQAMAGDVTDLGGEALPVATLRAVRTLPALVPPQTRLELHAACPPLDGDQMTGLHTHLQRAARAMRFPFRLRLVSTGNDRLDLPYTWLTHEGQLIGVFDQETVEGRDPVPLLGGGELRFDGQNAYLLMSRAPASGVTFYVDVYRPRSTWVGNGSTWLDSEVGPVLEDDEISVDLDQWVTVAYYFVCDSLSQSNPRGEIASWAKRRDRAAIRASPFMQWQSPAVTQRHTRTWTGSRHGRGYGRIGLGGWP